MKTLRAALCLLAFTLAAACLAAFFAGAGAQAQVVALAGLRNTAHHGSFKAASYLPEGTLVLLYDQGDGLRLLKTDAGAQTILAEAQMGAAGDTGVAMALDPAGDIYVAGTSTSGALQGTAGAVYPGAADASTNSFLAKFDPDLHLLFFSFLGAGKTAVTAVAATADATFVTGTTYNTGFPVTSGAAQPQASPGATAIGFVQRFTSDGAHLVYSTLLTGKGDTNPAALVADAADDAIVAGETSAADLPSVAALQPTMLGTSAGFLTSLTPFGTAFRFSTFVAGAGLTGLALDPDSGTLLAVGNINLGQFPIGMVTAPVANTRYQSLLHLSADGQTVLGSVLLAPGSSSHVSAGPHGTAWISGALGPPLFGLGSVGDSYLVHVEADGSVDLQQRFGGQPLRDAGNADLTSLVGILAVNADGTEATLPATLSASASAPLAPDLLWDVPLTPSPARTFNPGPPGTLPAMPADLLPSSCPGFSVCSGSAGLLATVDLAASGTSLSLSVGALPNLVLRNTGPVAASGLRLATSGYTFATDCTDTLPPAAQCGLVLAGGGPGSVSVTANNAPTLTLPLAPSTTPANPLVLDASELDFGVVTASSLVDRTVTVTNLSGTAQTVTSAPVDVPASPPYLLVETGSTCAGAAPLHTVAANSTCTLTLSLHASSQPTDDGPVRAAWEIAGRDLLLTGITEAADLSLSTSTLDFGVAFAGTTPRLPRFLYLSNNSTAPHRHTPVSLSADSRFALTDNCPSTLEPASVCQLVFTYLQTSTPAVDSVTVRLDEGLSVLVTGTLLPAGQVTGAPSAAQLTLSTTALRFADPVVVTELSTETGIVSITNTGTPAVPLSASIAGDFLLANACGPVLDAGNTCDLVIRFAPSGPAVREGLLQIFANPGSPPLTVTLSGTGSPLLLAENGTLALGSSLIGEPAITWYKVQTTVPSFAATVTGAAFGVALVEDEGSGHGTLPASAFAPAVAAPCSNCWLGVAFIPQRVGRVGATLHLATAPGGQPYALALTGTGLPVEGLILTPGTPDFGTVPLGSSSGPQTFTLANLLSPAAAVEITGTSTTGDFALLPDPKAGQPCHGVLASTASCFLQLSFTPTATGARAGTLTLTTTDGSVTVPLAGSGVPDAGLSLHPTSLTFANSPDARSSGSLQQTLTLTDTAGSPLTIASIVASDPSFTFATSCTILLPGKSCPITVNFVPGSSELSATLDIIAVAGTNAQMPPLHSAVPLTATFTGDEIGLVVSPSEADFGTGFVGTLGGTRQFTLQNTSASPEVVTLNVPQQFPLATPSACATLAPGESCIFAVSFLPQTGGPITGSILATAVSPTGTTSQAIGYLQGYGSGSGNLTISAPTLPHTPLHFGAVASGQTSAQTLTFTNSGTGPLTLRRLVSAPPFLTATTCAQTLDPGSTCTATLTYAPAYQLPPGSSPVPRADDDVLVIESDSSSSPDEVELTGTALPVLSNGSSPSPLLASYTLTQGSLTFANTPVGDTSAAQTLTVRNTGTATLNFGAVGTSPDFVATTSCLTLAPGATCTVTAAFAPSQQGSETLRSGSLTLQSNATDALEFVTLLGLSSPAPLTLSPLALDFGTVLLGASAQRPLTIANTASLPITLTAITATGEYTVEPGTCPKAGDQLPAGQSCFLLLTFAPTTTGIHDGTLSLATNATESPLRTALTGTAVAPRLQVAPLTLSFGSVKVGTAATLSLNLVNSGSATLNDLQTAMGGANSRDFRVTTPCPSATYSPLAGCTLGLSFTPTGVGSRTATLTLTSSDPLGPATITLNGTGTPASSFTLTVNGTSAATGTGTPGSPVGFPLELTPVGGFSGPVTLTCAAPAPAPYTACQLSATQVDLNGTPQAISAGLTTIGPTTSTTTSPWNLLLLTPLACMLRRRRGLSHIHLAFLTLATATLLGSTGCGGPGSTLGKHLAPPGTYLYRVTATAAGSQPITSSVILTLDLQY